MRVHASCPLPGRTVAKAVTFALFPFTLGPLAPALALWRPLAGATV